MMQEITLKQQCEIAISRLQSEMPQENSPIFAFHRNQTCIAIKGLAQIDKFENPDWFAKIMVDFVNAYLDKTDDWQSLIDKCNNRKTFRALKFFLAQREMAFYHIKHDLPNSLMKFGSGTDNDWALLEDVIKSCVDDANYSKFLNWRVKYRIIKLRNQVREKCLLQIKKAPN